MKKNLLVMAALFAGAFSYAQECAAVAELNEDFSDFTITQSNAFPQNCWSSSAGMPIIYTEQTEDQSNQYAVFYSLFAPNTYGYLVTPEISTIDGNHELSFSTWKAAQGGVIPPGNITVQIGVLSDAADFATFLPVGDAITVTDEAVIHSNIVVPASATHKYIAFKIISDAQHSAAAIDNVVWSEVPAECVAVATLDENFNGFAQSFDPVNQNCWSASAGSPLFYIDGNEESTENHVTFYTGDTADTTPAFLVTPELTTIDGLHSLSFDSALLTPGSTITIQVGTLAEPTDFAAFVPFGAAVTATADVISTTGLVIPASETQKYIAFKVFGSGVHGAAYIDNVKWDATAGVKDFAKGAFTIYPNPTATKNITVNFADASGKNLVSVYSLTGAKVLEAEVSGSQNLNLSALSAGMYIVKAQSGNVTATQKLVIQ